MKSIDKLTQEQMQSIKNFFKKHNKIAARVLAGAGADAGADADHQETELTQEQMQIIKDLDDASEDGLTWEPIIAPCMRCKAPGATGVLVILCRKCLAELRHADSLQTATEQTALQTGGGADAGCGADADHQETQRIETTSSLELTQEQMQIMKDLDDASEDELTREPIIAPCMRCKAPGATGVARREPCIAPRVILCRNCLAELRHADSLQTATAVQTATEQAAGDHRWRLVIHCRQPRTSRQRRPPQQAAGDRSEDRRHDRSEDRSDDRSEVLDDDVEWASDDRSEVLDDDVEWVRSEVLDDDEEWQFL